ncbi:MAG TPA: hypothetical protein VJZ75_08295 [Candidatus Bathyarchaeia archaeon]|nr:hypothetical protein [Candidatus Bathyarchaeia archaeon]
MVQRPSSDERFVAEAIDIVQRMKSTNIPLRIMAGCAVRIHCGEHVQLHQVKMQRNIRDIDLVTLRKYKKQLEAPLAAIGYSPQLVKFESDRDIYENKATGTTLDIFYNRLNMCHSIDFVDRMEIDFPTVSLADLVLQKLQIIEINERDAKDVIVLFLEHKVGESDRETINGKYIAKLLSDDWGFYYTVTENIKKNNNLALKYSEDMLSPQELRLFQTRTGQLLSMIDTEPKSFKWKMRQKIGTKTRWYSEVEEKERGTLAEYLINKQKGKQN